MTPDNLARIRSMLAYSKRHDLKHHIPAWVRVVNAATKGERA